jgi:hypothetical protein
MDFIRGLAYSVYVGPFPTIALVGFVTYLLVLATAVMASGKRWSRHLRRLPVKVHRTVGIVACFLATVHMLMGISATIY